MKPQEILARKFAQLRRTGHARRPDYKGERRRLGLRVSEELWLQLRILQFATGEDKNGFIERTVKIELARRLKELEEQNGAGRWESIVACAKVRPKLHR